MRVLVTGAGGFVGRALVQRLGERGHVVRAAVRTPDRVPAGAPERVTIGNIGPDTAWEEALDGVDAVIHLAARVHVMEDRASDPLTLYRRINAEGTRALAAASARAGVRRLVFVSSIKVNGEETVPGRPFTPGDAPCPADPYGRSKAEAEAALREVAEATGLQVCVVRPPLVYGPGVRANFLRLLEAVDRGIPIPLGALCNRRSLVYVGNLADALATCAEHPAAAGETFLVADEPPFTPPELVRAIAVALGRRPRLLPVPARLLAALGRTAGRTDAVRRVAGWLEVDGSHLRRTLGWEPPVGVEEAMRATVRGYREGRAGGR